MKKALIVGLVLPLASVVSLGDAAAISYIGTPTARPATASRMPTLAGLTTIRTASMVSVDAGLLATCAEPLRTRFTTSNCVRNYEACLREDDVCGANFQLCSNIRQFNKKRILCQDSLARCPSDGIKALFGNSVTTSDDTAVANRAVCDSESVIVKRSFSPALQDLAVAGDSPIQMWIKEGNSWLATNSVEGCNKVADDCIKQACAASPHKCIAADSFTTDDANNMVNIISSSETSIRLNASIIKNFMDNLGWGSSNVNSYLREQCRETIGSNEACFTVVNPGKLAREADLIDRDSINEVYRDIMESGINARFKMNQSRIKEWTAQAALNAAEACKAAMVGCAINACGEGSTARCYGLAKNTSTGAVDIKGMAGTGITNQCKNVIENNQSCKDVFVSKGGNPSEAWDKIWTQDSIGAISGLSIELSQAFNEQAVANMRRKCQTAAETCVENECAPDFTACFISSIEARNMRSKKVVNGVVTGKAWNGGFDGEMAKGLCLLEVKKDESCRNFFDVEYARNSKGASGDSWGTSSNARNAWLASPTTSGTSLTFCSPNYTYSLGDLSTNVSGNANATFIAQCAEQERNIFGTLIADIGTRVQSVFERKANEAKTACKDAGDGFFWTTLPDQNARHGLKRQGTEDTFGGSCQIEARLEILIKNQPVKNIDNCVYSYFGDPGDVIGCGEWLTDDCLENIETAVRNSEVRSDEQVKRDTQRANKIGALVGTIGGLGLGGLGAWGGYTLGDKIASGGDAKAVKKDAEIQKIDGCLSSARNVESTLTACGEYKYKSGSSGETEWVYFDVEPSAANLCGIENRVVNGYTCAYKGGSISAQGSASTRLQDIKRVITQLEADRKAQETKVAANREQKHNAWGISGASILGAVGAAGGIWAGVETANAMKNKAADLERDKQDAAYLEWYTSIGSKIQCRMASGTERFNYRVPMTFKK